MQNLEPQKLIASSPLFHHLQPHEAEAISTRLQLEHYEQGRRVLERGIWHGRLYIVLSGQVSVLLQEDKDGHTHMSAQIHAESGPHHGHPYIVARLGAGECFGEMSLLTGEPPNATILVEQDADLWALSQTDFLTLLGTCPTLLQNINTILAQRLNRTNRQVVAKRAAERIWLAFNTPTDTMLERSLALHIAAALAERSQRRVLLIEMCAPEDAAGQHFAIHPQQARPGVIECANDPHRLTRHAAPTLSPEGTHIPALSTFGAPNDLPDPAIATTLADLAAHYDYLLFATTSTTPAPLLGALAERHLAEGQTAARVIALVAAAEASSPDALAFTAHYEPTVVITRVSEPLTIRTRDHYANALGVAVSQLLPSADAVLEQCWQMQTPLRQRAPDSTSAKAVDFIARSLARQTVGIAFGGGGARGFAHLGVMERLLYYGVPLDYIAACSSGIITPGMYLIGKTFAESEEIFLEIQRHIVQWRVPRTSLFSNRGIKHMLRELCGDLCFEDLTTPFAMVAVDLATRSGVVLDRGPLWQAGLASVALPGIFPPVLIGEHILMDAGMHDPVPIRLVRRMGADILLASELGGQEPPGLERAAPWLEQPQEKAPRNARSPHIVDLLLRTYDLAMATIGMHSIREADVVIRPSLHRVSLRQFSEGRKFVAAGREAVEQALPDLRRRLPWLPTTAQG